MPYITKAERVLLHEGAQAINAGHLNYQLSMIVDEYLFEHGVSYASLNDVMGVLACMQQEIYRRIAAPLENSKIEQNGDVFTCLEQ